MTLADEVSRNSARDAAREELARREYDDAQPSVVVRALGRALRELAELLDGAAATLGNGPVATTLLVLLLAGITAVVLVRLGPLAGRDRQQRALFEAGGARTAAEHRAAAESAAAEGRFADAVRERLRAVVRELEARGVLDPRPGRTAAEVAHDAGAVVPALVADLRRAAGLFEEVWYGGRTADRGSYDVLVQVDQRVRGTRTVGV